MDNFALSRVRRRRDLAFRAIDDETWVISPRDSRLHRLNRTAARLWDLLDGEPTVAALGAALAREFTVGAVRAQTDAARFVTTLAEQGLVDVLPPDLPPDLPPGRSDA